MIEDAIVLGKWGPLLIFAVIMIVVFFLRSKTRSPKEARSEHERKTGEAKLFLRLDQYIKSGNEQGIRSILDQTTDENNKKIAEYALKEIERKKR